MDVVERANSAVQGRWYAHTTFTSLIVLILKTRQKLAKVGEGTYAVVYRGRYVCLILKNAV